jgi:hypothetical protein
MPLDPSRAIQGPQSSDDRRTVIAFVSATVISIAVLVLLAVFDVK